MMNNKIQKLLQLVKDNPDLPILPVVDSELICGDEYCRYLGSFGDCYIGEYALFKDKYYDDRDEFEEDYYDYHQEELDERFDYNPWNREKEKRLNEYLHKIADKFFKKAIFVNIDFPEDDTSWDI